MTGVGYLNFQTVACRGIFPGGGRFRPRPRKSEGVSPTGGHPLPTEESASVEVEPGLLLEARLELTSDARGGLVVCHPHPLYGGDMDNPVVVRSVEVAREAGLATLRFNFRGVGASQGTHAKGAGEQDDVRAALAALGSRLRPGSPLGLAGYSFGAWVSARVAARTADLSGVALIAPPVAMLDFGDLSAASFRNLFIVAGTRDTYCPIPELDRLVERLPGARVAQIEGAEHFFFGKLYPLGEALRGWIASWAPA